MEEASDGKTEEGQALLNKGADVSATPLSFSRDPALSTAADIGHYTFRAVPWLVYYQHVLSV